MDNTLNLPPATQESILAIMQETNRMMQETNRMLQESKQELKESGAEFDRKLAESGADFDRKLAESGADFDRKLAESGADFDRKLAESGAEFDRKLAESRAEMKASGADFDRKLAESREESIRRMKVIEQTMGGWSNNHGSFAEEYFYNSFDRGKCNFFGEKYDLIERNIKSVRKDLKDENGKELKDEYDIVMYNSVSVAIVETKFKAHKENIAKIIKKAKTFKQFYPYHADYKIYLGFASLHFPPDVESYCLEKGIAVIKQVGDTVVIHDGQMKAF